MQTSKNRKLGIIFLLISAAVIAAAICVYSISSPRTEVTNAGSIYNELLELEGVIDVTPVPRVDKKGWKENTAQQYMIIFEQPIDWNDRSAGTFSQRVFVDVKGKNQINHYLCDGYALYDSQYPTYFEEGYHEGMFELAELYDANFINIEYRFNYKSVPKDISLDEPDYWKYLTSENASKDFHHIITELRKVLPGKTIFTGASKGGYATECMAYYFPDDIDAYVSYVAPLCDGTADERFCQNIFETIGDMDYGTKQALEYRNLIMEFVKIMLDAPYRDRLQEEFERSYDESGYHLSPQVSTEEAFEASIADMISFIWQYDQDFDAIQKIIDLPDNTEAQKRKKEEALLDYYLSFGPVEDTAYDSLSGAYYIQSYLEMGNYKIDLSYLREAGANILTPEENDEDLAQRLWAPVTIGNSLLYDSSMREKLIQFFETTKKDIIRIEAKSDPWYAVRMPEVNNPHIHVYEVSGTHDAQIQELDKDKQKECLELLDSILGYNNKKYNR